MSFVIISKEVSKHTAYLGEFELECSAFDKACMNFIKDYFRKYTLNEKKQLKTEYRFYTSDGKIIRFKNNRRSFVSADELLRYGTISYYVLMRLSDDNSINCNNFYRRNKISTIKVKISWEKQ